MDLNLLTLNLCQGSTTCNRTSLCFMQQGIKFSDGLTRMAWFCWYSVTETGKNTRDIQGPTDWHTYNYILTPSVMCTQQLPVLLWMINLLIQKFTFQRSTVPLFFKNCSPVGVTYVLIRFNKIKSYLWNTKNTDRNSVNSKTYTPHTERKITSERVGSC